MVIARASLDCLKLTFTNGEFADQVIAEAQTNQR